VPVKNASSLKSKFENLAVQSEEENKRYIYYYISLHGKGTVSQELTVAFSKVLIFDDQLSKVVNCV
jgi:hypothetical protein